MDGCFVPGGSGAVFGAVVPCREVRIDTRLMSAGNPGVFCFEKMSPHSRDFSHELGDRKS